MLSERVNTCQTCWSSNVCVCWTQAAETPVWTSCYTVSSSQLDGSDPRPQRGLHPSWRRFVAGNISAFLTCVNKLKIYKFNTKILTYNKCLIQKYVTQNYKLNNCLMVFLSRQPDSRLRNINPIYDPHCPQILHKHSRSSLPDLLF